MISSWFYCRLSALVIKFHQTNIVHKESKYHSQLRLIQFPLWFLCPLTSSSLACPFLYQLRQDPACFVLSGTQHIRERRPRCEQLGSDTWDRGGACSPLGGGQHKNREEVKEAFSYFSYISYSSCLVPASHLYFVLSFLLGLLLRGAGCRSNKNYGKQTVAIHLKCPFLYLPLLLLLRFGDHFTA